MNTAKQINQKLDELLAIRAEIKRIQEEVADDAVLNNVDTGEKQDKEGVIKLAEGMIDQVKDELYKLTNEGKSITGIFDNTYYVNDMIQDKIIVENTL